MEFKRPHSSEILRRVAPPLAIWAITKILGSEPVARAVERVDRRIEQKKRSAERSLARVRRNAIANPVMLTAGMIAIVAGIGLIVKAASTRK